MNKMGFQPKQTSKKVEVSMKDPPLFFSTNSSNGIFAFRHCNDIVFTKK